MMMMRSLAQELAPERIRVNAIAPGAIRQDREAVALGRRRGWLFHAPIAKKLAISGAGALISTTIDSSMASRP